MSANRLLENLRETGEAYADAKAAADAVEEHRRNALASLIVGFMDKGASKAKAEEQARSSEEYSVLTDTLLKRKDEAVRAKMAYDLAQVAIDLYRTEAASRRAELENLHAVP